MISIETAREWLRIDGTDNDEIIQGLLRAVPDYIHIATGMTPCEQEGQPLADTATKFLLTLWYNAEQAEAERLQKAIDHILKTLSLIAATKDYNIE